LQGVDSDRPAHDDMSEEQMLRALMEAQGQR
jgi:DNA-directed RNA polymerase subunit omega